MQGKQIHPWFRNAFHAGSFLSLVAGIQLFVLSERTDIYFAWTIQSALTAATLGGFYFGSMTFGYLSARETLWKNVRGPAVGLLLFLSGSLAATLMHLDKFHLASENFITRAAAWIWLAIYVLMPPLLALTFVLQSRIQGLDEKQKASLPVWYRAIYAFHGAAGIVTGVGLLVAPRVLSPLWLWALTPLTARALSAWFVSFGVLDLISAMETDWRRLRVTSIGYIVTSIFGLFAILRYAGQADLTRLAGAGYLFYLLVMLGLGMYGWRKARQS